MYVVGVEYIFYLYSDSAEFMKNEKFNATPVFFIVN